MHHFRYLWIIGLLGSLGVAGCCQSRTGEGSRLCLVPGFFKTRNTTATIPIESSSSPIVSENPKTGGVVSKEGRPEKAVPKMPPVTDLPVAPTLPQRLSPPPRVPTETSPRLNPPSLPRPTELPTLPPLSAPPEAKLKPAPETLPLIIPTEEIAEKPAATPVIDPKSLILPEIVQVGRVEETPALSAVKTCEGETSLQTLVKSKAGKSHPVASAALPQPPTTEPTTTLPSADTKTLSGKVQQWRGSWVLRYASIDAVDEHGGRVTLFGGPELDRLREGQQVRVQGVLLPAEVRHESPRFRVTRIVDKE
jgi:hypothetical protein